MITPNILRRWMVCWVGVLAFGAGPAGAGPLDLGGHTKAEVDAAARSAGFVEMNWPTASAWEVSLGAGGTLGRVLLPAGYPAIYQKEALNP